jgi:hypothetical protein
MFGKNFKLKSKFISTHLKNGDFLSNAKSKLKHFILKFF